jgi:hypothetical protein
MAIPIVLASCGLGDKPGLDRVLKAIDVVKISYDSKHAIITTKPEDLILLPIRDSPIPTKVKGFQGTSLLGDPNYRTCVVEDKDLLLVVLYAYAKGPYTCVRIFIQNKSANDTVLDWESCRLKAFRTSATTLIGLENPRGGRALPPLVAGFGCESTDYIIVDLAPDKGKAPIGDLLLSGDGINAYMHLGCRPDDEGTQIIVSDEEAELAIPGGLYAVVTLCFLSRAPTMAEFEIVLRRVGWETPLIYGIAVTK